MLTADQLSPAVALSTAHSRSQNGGIPVALQPSREDLELAENLNLLNHANSKQYQQTNARLAPGAVEDEACSAEDDSSGQQNIHSHYRQHHQDPPEQHQLLPAMRQQARPEGYHQSTGQVQLTTAHTSAQLDPTIIRSGSQVSNAPITGQICR